MLGVASTLSYYLAQPNHFLPKSAGSRHLMYLRKLQRSESHLTYLRYNVREIHRRHNLPNLARNQVPEIILTARLKHVHTVAELSSAAHNRLGRFQAVAFSHAPAIAVVVAPEVVVVNLLFVRCPALWWTYLRS
jgi:hypothetical protein